MIITSKDAWPANSRVTEHIFERRFAREIIIALATGIFEEDVTLDSGPLDKNFMIWLLEGRSTAPPAMTGMSKKKVETKNAQRLMWTLGSKQNKAHFVIAGQKMNGLKTHVRYLTANLPLLVFLTS